MQRASGIAAGRRDVSAVGEDAALAEPRTHTGRWRLPRLHAGDGIWPAISGAGQVLTGAAPDELDRKIRAHWQAMQ